MNRETYKLASIFAGTILLSLITFIGAYNYLPLGWFEPDPVVGSTITTINASDTLRDSRAVINTNFANLNTDKLERSDYFASTSKPNLAVIGTITTGVWNGTAIGAQYGGTGSTTLSSGMILFGNGTGAINAATSTGNAGQVLTSGGAGTLPYWGSSAVDQTLAYNWTGVHSWTATTSFATSTIASTSITNLNLGSTYIQYPTSSTSIPSKGYVDDVVTTLQTAFVMAYGITYYATTSAGIVTCYISADGGAASTMDGLSDSSNPPTTRIAYYSAGSAGHYGTITFPVLKNEYFKVNMTNASTYACRFYYWK